MSKGRDMKYAKPQKYVFGERPARPPYGEQVFATITSKREVFDPERLKRRVIADSWDIHVHKSATEVVLMGRLRRCLAAGYSLQIIDGSIEPWVSVKSSAEAKKIIASRLSLV